MPSRRSAAHPVGTARRLLRATAAGNRQDLLGPEYARPGRQDRQAGDRSRRAAAGGARILDHRPVRGGVQPRDVGRDRRRSANRFRPGTVQLLYRHRNRAVVGGSVRPRLARSEPGRLDQTCPAGAAPDNSRSARSGTDAAPDRARLPRSFARRFGRHDGAVVVCGLGRLGCAMGNHARIRERRAGRFGARRKKPMVGGGVARGQRRRGGSFRSAEFLPDEPDAGGAPSGVRLPHAACGPAPRA